MLAVTAVLICAIDFSLGKIMAIKVKGIANSKFKYVGIFAPRKTPVTVDICQKTQSVRPPPSKW